MLCGSCFHEIPPGSAFCPRCGARQEPAGLPAAPAAAPATAGPAPVYDNPWENRGGRGRFEAFGETLQQALFHPARFFRGTDPGGSAAPALGFSVVIGTVSIAIMVLWQVALGTYFGDGAGLGAGTGGRFAPLALLVLLPMWVALSNLVAAAVLHVSLLLLRGARGGYGTTLKAVCYSSAAAAFNVVPVAGFFVGAAWQFAVSVIGLRELHRSCCTAQAVLAYLLPVVLAFALLVAVAVVATLAGIGAFMHLLQRGVQV